MGTVRGRLKLHSAALYLLLFPLLCLGSVCHAADSIPAKTVTVAKGAGPGTFDVRVEKAKLTDVVAALAREAGVSIRLGPGVQERTVERLDLKGFPLYSVFLALAEQNPRLKVSHVENGWVLWEAQPPVPGQIECSMRVMSVRTEDVDALFAAHLSDDNRCRLPGGVAMLRGDFSQPVNALLAKGLVTVINEPHIITADGQEAEISFHTSEPQMPPPDIMFPDFVCGGLERSFIVLPKRMDKELVAVALSLSTAWFNAAPQPPGNRRLGPRRSGSVYALVTELPWITLAPEQQLLVRGWPGGTSPAENENGRETIATLTAAVVLGEQR